MEIRLEKRAEQIGLAVMLQDLISQNIEQNPHKQIDFNRLCIAIGLEVPDVAIQLTLVFSNQSLTIFDGIKDQPGLRIKSDSQTVMNLSNQKIKWGLPYYFDDTGRQILKAMKSGRLQVKGMLSHFPSLIRFSRVMSIH